MAILSSNAKNAPNQVDSDHRHSLNGPKAFQRWRINHLAKRSIMITCLGISALGMTGCTLGSGATRALCDTECIDDFMIGYRNRAMAERAWHCRRHLICDKRYTREYKDGFIAGYLDIASGGNGCTPAVAPSKFLGWQYQTPGGRCAVNAWFQGFPLGVKAAEEDGVGHWQSMWVNGYQRSAALPAASAPTFFPEDQPAVANPFYSNEEVIPTPEPDQFDDVDPTDSDREDLPPGQIEPIEIPDIPDESDNVFNGLFPPVRFGESNMALSAPDAVVAEGSSSADDDDDLPFSFE